MPELAKRIIAAVVKRIPTVADWPEHRALAGAILTDRALWPAKMVSKLGAIPERMKDEG